MHVRTPTVPAIQPVDSGFSKLSVDMQFISITAVAPPNGDAIVKIAVATTPLAMALPLAPRTERRTSPVDTGLDVKLRAPALAETKASLVASKLRSIWKDDGAVVLAKDRLNGIRTVLPGTPTAPGADKVTVDGRLRESIGQYYAVGGHGDPLDIKLKPGW